MTFINLMGNVTFTDAQIKTRLLRLRQKTWTQKEMDDLQNLLLGQVAGINTPTAEQSAAIETICSKSKWIIRLLWLITICLLALLNMKKLPEISKL